MKEVVIGFPLSYEAIMLYAKYSGFKLYAYAQKDIDHLDSYIKFDPSKQNNNWGITYNKNDLGDETIADKLYGDGYFDDDSIERDDKNLIRVVKELRKKAGYETKIVQIPDDIKWYVTETEDGHEYIEEEHRTWS